MQSKPIEWFLHDTNFGVSWVNKSFLQLLLIKAKFELFTVMFFWGFFSLVQKKIVLTIHLQFVIFQENKQKNKNANAFFGTL